jgi:hypothetical protein
MSDIYPTQHCFDDAVDFIEAIIKSKQAFDECFLLIVHSICLMPDGTPYAHAWVEDPSTDTCIFKGIFKREEIYLQADRKEFYAEYKVQETTKYTVKQACIENMRTGIFGPWEEKYLVLTKNGSNKMIMRNGQ